ncbi:hypothetical protein ACU4GD_18885 [Cupriavidus basilensis]
MRNYVVRESASPTRRFRWTSWWPDPVARGRCDARRRGLRSACRIRSFRCLRNLYGDMRADNSRRYRPGQRASTLLAVSALRMARCDGMPPRALGAQPMLASQAAPGAPVDVINPADHRDARGPADRNASRPTCDACLSALPSTTPLPGHRWPASRTRVRAGTRADGCTSNTTLVGIPGAMKPARPAPPPWPTVARSHLPCATRLAGQHHVRQQ